MIFCLLIREACKYIQEHLTINVDELGKESIVNVAKTSMSSKLIGQVSDFFSEMVVNAVMAVKRAGNKGEAKYPIKAQCAKGTWRELKGECSCRWLCS